MRSSCCAVLNTPSCALKLEQSLCQGIAYGKGCLGKGNPKKVIALIHLQVDRPAPCYSGSSSQSLIVDDNLLRIVFHFHGRGNPRATEVVKNRRLFAVS
jgi:hypothetical protein